MNPNRQNMRFGGPGCRPAQVQNCNTVTPAPFNTPCDSCGTGVTGGIIIGQQYGDACDKETVLQGLPIAMAYVPWQNYGNIYPLQQALQNGTMFRELDLEFAGRRCN